MAPRTPLVLLAAAVVPAASMVAAVAAVQFPEKPAAAAAAAVRTRSPALARPIHKQVGQPVLGRATVIIRPVPVMVVQAVQLPETERLVREALL